MSSDTKLPVLKLLPRACYADVDRGNPIRFYYWPLLGAMYRRRVELCLAELRGGHRILEVGFGSGVTFLNLSESYDEIHGLDLTAPVETVVATFASTQIEPHLQNGNVQDMPYDDGFFDTVLLISILEHLEPHQLGRAFEEIHRVLKRGGQVVYGVPMERPLMTLAFRLLGYNIRKHHFSNEREIAAAASKILQMKKVVQMPGIPSVFGPVYAVRHFIKK
jgi:ubiquinone/menaquinone biosynthesis C-methylase UbiE